MARDRIGRLKKVTIPLRFKKNFSKELERGTFVSSMVVINGNLISLSQYLSIYIPTKSFRRKSHVFLLIQFFVLVDFTEIL